MNQAAVSWVAELRASLYNSEIIASLTHKEVKRATLGALQKMFEEVNGIGVIIITDVNAIQPCAPDRVPSKSKQQRGSQTRSCKHTK